MPGRHHVATIPYDVNEAHFLNGNTDSLGYENGSGIRPNEDDYTWVSIGALAFGDPVFIQGDRRQPRLVEILKRERAARKRKAALDKVDP